MMKTGEIDGYMLKPMNCPHHVKILHPGARSIATYHHCDRIWHSVSLEQSGEISGMTRVRLGFTQDDAHLFVTEDQIAQEVLGCIELCSDYFR